MNEELRVAFDRLDAALAEARAALEKPEPGPEPEPEPFVEVAGLANRWRYTRITQFERDTIGWRVWGDCANKSGHAYIETYNITDASPFSIWQECVAAGVPCPEPPYITLHTLRGVEVRFCGVDEISGSCAVRGMCCVPGGSGIWHDACHVVRESPAAIRDACAAAGVPCAEEEPKTITAETLSGNTCCFRAVSAINAVHRDVDGPCLRIVGDSQFATHVFTRTPLADIRAQAADAGIELPDATVFEDGTYWRSISCVECRWGTSDIHTAMFGDRVDYDPCQDGVYTDLTPAQVVALCQLAGWPKPEVRMVYTYADGDQCEVAPNNISGVGIARHATIIETNTPLADGSYIHHVRELGKQVRAMIDACKEVSDDGNM